ncbi:tripartite tricarboxylate transporter substrate binding protein [uncultured Alsobacter sp.]|uniref:Bug family tripartite tricarboxylate transporter substrate binding protein n=1 Tax=uncultured Alsobacter sp. TaxID=1748258 RepID=UPI0025F7E23F|nr:tripartite tricarboxylate transporter substrate-binding protein [uncultured Alsobacter sp.]
MIKKTLLAAATLAGMTVGAWAEPAKVMVPAGAGGGYDTTGRLAMKVLDSAGIFKDGAVFTNKPGAGGTLGMGEFIRNNKGDNNALMAMGVILVGSQIVTKGSLPFSEVTPIARLTFEFSGIGVPASSNIKTMKDLQAALKANIGAVPFGGGSAGGVDHIMAGLIARSSGAEVPRLNYIPFASGAEAVTQLAGGKLQVLIQGASEMKQLHDAGRIRLIAVSSEQRIPGIDVPTLKEQGVDIVMGNWRGIVGANGMSAEATKTWVERFEKMSQTKEWQEELKKQGLENAFLGGAAFGKFLNDEHARMLPILTDMGLVK